MDVADKLHEIGVFFTDDGLVPVLKEMAVMFVSSVIGYGIPGKESSHEIRKGSSSGPEKQMRMIGHKRPGIAQGGGFGNEGFKALKKAFLIGIALEDPSSFDPADHHMMKDAGGIESGGSRHNVIIYSDKDDCQEECYYFMDVPKTSFKRSMSMISRCSWYTSSAR